MPGSEPVEVNSQLHRVRLSFSPPESDRNSTTFPPRRRGVDGIHRPRPRWVGLIRRSRSSIRPGQGTAGRKSWGPLSRRLASARPAGGLGTTSAGFFSSGGILTTSLPTGTRATRKPSLASRRDGGYGVAVRRPAVSGAGDPAAAPGHPMRGPVSGLLGIVTPLPDVAVHVVQTQPIRLVRAHLARPLQPSPCPKFACAGNNWFVGLSK